jgi:hypothetical protein
MERLLYVGIGGLRLGDRAAESFRRAYQVRAGLGLHSVHNLTAHGLLRRFVKEGKPKKGFMCVPRRTCADLASLPQVSPDEAVEECREHDQRDDDVGAISEGFNQVVMSMSHALLYSSSGQ